MAIKDKISMRDVLVLAGGLLGGGGITECAEAFIMVSDEIQEYTVTKVIVQQPDSLNSGQVVGIVREEKIERAGRVQ